MSTFVFRAVDVAGVKSRGEVEADSKQAVAQQLRAQGLIVLDVADKGLASRSLNIEILNRIKLGELAIMTRQLATMVSSGMTILRAFYVLEAQTENKKLAEVLVRVRKDIEAGLPLSDALERHPKVFNELYVAMTRSGETGGMLETALLRVADQLEKEESLRRQVKSAMVYPAVVMSFAALVLIALVAFIVPVFVKVFKQFGSDLPAITEFTVTISNLVTHQWYLLIGAVVLLVVAFRKWKGSKAGHAQWDAMKLRIPMKIGDIVQKIALARWSRTLSGLVSAGVPLLQALEITARLQATRSSRRRCRTSSPT